MSELEWLGVFLTLSGIFLGAASSLNWDFFFNHRQARLVVRLIGRTRARVPYCVIGGVVYAGGTAILLGHLTR